MVGSGRRTVASRWTRAVGPAVALFVLQLVVWPVPAGTLVSGVVLGLVGALVPLGLALVWRANRIVNFAQGDLGVLPATFGVLLITAWHWSYVAGLAVGLLSAALLGALVEALFVRRFSRSPRMIPTIATIGVAQLLSFATLMLPRAWGLTPANLTIDAPWHLRFTIGAVVFGADDVIGVVVAVAAMLGLVGFLRGTDTGVAVRAAAERPDRASMLGVPVGRLQTQVWAIAAVLSFASVYFTAAITSLSPGFSTSLTVVLRALAALVIARMSDLVTVGTTSVALGVVDQAIRAHAHSDAESLAPVVFVVIILVALIARRASLGRVDDRAGSWHEPGRIRSVPPELARLAEVRAVRWGLAVVATAAVVVFPHLVGTGPALKGGAVLVFGTIGVSMVILCGWAGQVSLGQMTFVGVGAAVAAWGTVDRALDPIASIPAAGLAGALVALVVGLPALRLRGLYLAVTTLGLALAASAALFSNTVWDVIPTGTFARPSILHRISLDSATRVYYLALVLLVLALVAVRGIRRSRTGRVLVAIRDNERAAAAYGVSVVRAKLTAFALSGFLAASAGAVFAIQQASFRSDSYDASQSLAVFVAAVIGGLASVPGALLGATYLRGAQWLLPGDWQLLAGSAGVLAVLLVMPGGLADVVYRVRDRWLRWVAARHGIAAPNLRGNEGLVVADPLAVAAVGADEEGVA